MRRSSFDKTRLMEQTLDEIRAGRLLEADRLCSQLLAAYTDDPATLQLAATVAHHRGRLADAERLIGSSLSLRPEHVPSLLLAGRIARAMGELPRAIALFGRAREIAPDQPQAIFSLCGCLLQIRDRQAQTLVAQLLTQFPGEANGWAEIGGALEEAGQMEAAATAYARAAGNSADPAYSARLGRCLMSLGRLQEALVALRQSLESAPLQFESRLMLGSCLRQLGASQSAIAEYKRATEISATDSRGWFALGNACDDVRDPDGAIAAYRKAAGLLPTLPEAHVNLGLDLQHAGDLEGAMTSYAKAMELRPEIFGRISQALTSGKTGQLWLNLEALRESFRTRAFASRPEAAPINAGA